MIKIIFIIHILRKLKRQRERLCRYVYNQILTAECTQLNRTWPDPDDPRWNSGEYAELLPDWFPTNATNASAFGNATTSSTLGNVIEIKLHHATCAGYTINYVERIHIQQILSFFYKSTTVFLLKFLCKRVR